MKWSKYTIKTTTQAEDLISGMLMENGIEGIEINDNVPLTKEDVKYMFIDFLPDIPEDKGIGYVTFYLDDDDDREEVLSRVRDGLEELRMFVDIGEATISESETEDKDWINNWKEFFKPFTVDDILIKPTWETVAKEDEDKLLIQIDPGTAFGTGMHETTQLCIRQLKNYINEDTTVLDVGCGSGILSIIALKLGAKQAFGTDIDPNAIIATNENIEVNGIDKDRFKVIIGNIIDDEEVQKEVGFDKYDVVMANILAEILIPLSSEIHNHLKIGGTFITSGIINTKEEEVVNALKNNECFEILTVTRQNDWVSVTAKRVK